MKTHLLHLPLSIPVSQKKNFSLNLNVYRNENFHTLNKAKEVFHKYIGQILDGIPPMKRVMLIYTLFFGSKRRVDISNICSIVDKFFCDTLTEKLIIPDDSYDVVQEVIYRFGGIDKENPRVEALIIDLDSLTDQEDKDMRITLVQSEIEEALTDYIKRQVNLRDGQTISIDFKATRGNEGYSAEIAIDTPSKGIVNTKEPVTSNHIVTAEEVFTPPNGTALQIENSAQQQAAEMARTEAPVAQAEVIPPQTTEPVQTQSPDAPVVAPAATQSAPTSVPDTSSRSLFANLTPPVNTPKVEG